jgi:hypothetical protein
MQIYHFMYVSEKSDYFDINCDLDKILTKSRSNNRKRRISGILMWDGKFFIQLLEGKKEDVVAIYRLILEDRRHRGIKELLNFHSEERVFPKWSMGIINRKTHLPMRKLVPLLHQDVNFKQSGKEKVIAILKSFNELEQN